MVTITRHVFTDFFQTKHFLAVKLYMGYEQNISFLVIPKSPKVGKQVEKIGLGSLSCVVNVKNHLHIDLFLGSTEYYL